MNLLYLIKLYIHFILILLAFNYMIEARKNKGINQPNDMVIKTIVTTDMIDVIAKHHGVACYNVLTGFKWIASLIKEKEGKENYIVGGEESFGLMIGNEIRDKDAVSAVAILCEMAAVEKAKLDSIAAAQEQLMADSVASAKEKDIADSIAMAEEMAAAKKKGGKPAQKKKDDPKSNNPRQGAVKEGAENKTPTSNPRQGAVKQQ
jgi:phosphomannomutase